MSDHSLLLAILGLQGLVVAWIGLAEIRLRELDRQKQDRP